MTRDCDKHKHLTTSPAAVSYNQAVLEKTAHLFEAMGDPARLRLLVLLTQGELCVSEIAATTREGMSTISQRLKLLRSEGLVVSRREGKHIFYRLDDQHIAELITNALSHINEQLAVPANLRDTRVSQGVA